MTFTVVNDFLILDSTDMFVAIHYLRNRALQLLTQENFDELYTFLYKVQERIIEKIESETRENIRIKYIWLMKYFDETIKEISVISINNITIDVYSLFIERQYHQSLFSSQF